MSGTRASPTSIASRSTNPLEARVGQNFYRAAEAWAYGTGKSVLAAEVNTVPDNPASHRFHQAFGFVEVGRAKPYGGEEEVAYYEKKL